MLRILFAFVIVVHGLIHFLGFAKANSLLHVDQLSQPIPKSLGLTWLLIGFLFLTGAFGFLMRKEWWMLLPIAALLSQILIFIYWQDAKYGTLINTMIILICAIAYGTWSFNRKVESEISALMTSDSPTQNVITRESISHLPPMIQKWMERSRALENSSIQLAYIKQTGRMKTTPDGRWMTFSAQQFINVTKPGFIWQAHVRALPLFHLSARDKYAAGHGNMLIKLQSLVTIANESGYAIDQGSLCRFLAEMIWYPSAALNDYVEWKEIDKHTVEATIKYQHTSATGIFTFTPSGDVASFETLRYYIHKNESSLEKWYINIDENSYDEFEGRRIPKNALVTWKLKSGDFTWYRLEVQEVRYNAL